MYFSFRWSEPRRVTGKEYVRVPIWSSSVDRLKAIGDLPRENRVRRAAARKKRECPGSGASRAGVNFAHANAN